MSVTQVRLEVDAAALSPTTAPSAWPTRSLCALYLMLVGTLGLCLPFWVYHNARVLEPDARAKRKHLGWALACWMPPMAALVTYEIARVATARLQRAGRPRLRIPLLVGCACAFAFGLAFVSRLHDLLSLKLLLLPVPVVLAHAALNRLAAYSPVNGGASSGPATQHWRWPWLIAAVAVPVGAAALHSDAGRIALLSKSSYTHGARVRGASGRYELTIEQGEWRHVAPGTFADESSDLELQRVDGASWFGVYVDPAGDTNLDARVAARRKLVESAGTLKELGERRVFLEGPNYVVSSLAFYKLVAPLDEEAFWVLTTVAEETIIEVVFHSGRPDDEQASALALLNSFRLLTPGSAR